MKDGISGYDVRDMDDAYLFLLGVVLNQQIRAEQAWQAPRQLMSRLCLGPATGKLAWSVHSIPPEAILAALTSPSHLHPFADSMSRNVCSATELVCKDYDGDTRQIWAQESTQAQVIDRLQRVRGIGRHKAEVAVYLLTNEQHLPFADPDIPNLAIGCPRLRDTFGDPAVT